MGTDPNTPNFTCQDDENADGASQLLDAKPGIQSVWDLAAEGRCTVLVGTSSAHANLYDEHGLSR